MHKSLDYIQSVRFRIKRLFSLLDVCFRDVFQHQTHAHISNACLLEVEKLYCQSMATDVCFSDLYACTVLRKITFVKDENLPYV